MHPNIFLPLHRSSQRWQRRLNLNLSFPQYSLSEVVTDMRIGWHL
jgi:hypothetical protein